MNAPNLNIRPETFGDEAAIADVIAAAFHGMPYADGDEAELVNELRRRAALSVSLVAELGEQVIGHIAFSPASTNGNDAGWYALGPLAVLPAHQGTGVGSALVRQGLEALRRLRACGCILVGHPQIYAHFGFIHAPQSAPAGEPPEHFMLKLLIGSTPAGPISFHELFRHEPR